MNSMENREINYRNKKGHKPYNYTYQRNQGFYVGNRGYNFTNNYSNNGTSTSFSKNAFHSRHTRYYQHNRRESSQIYKEYHWQQSRKIRREPSPLNGSEEYTLRKIQETSDMIKRKLMSPEYTPDDYTIDKVSEPINNKSTKVKLKFNKNKMNKESSLIKRKLQKKADLRAKMYKCLTVEKSSDATYNVKEIHDQIMNHISKLNYGRRQNLINADTTCYDAALQQMYKQKSLELSKALREMSHQEKPEASEVVNSIIPDFAIKFEELPIHVIRELSSTFETLEKNIGNDDTSTFDFFTYSTDNQGNPSPIYDGFQEYQPNEDTFQTDSNSTINYVESKIDDRVLVVNSEDADTLVIKEENLNEMLIKMETNDIEIEDDANNENNLSHSLISTQDSSIHPEVLEEPIQDNTNIGQFHADNKLDTSSNSKTAVCSETSAVIGTVRVNQSLFENTNEIISNENQNDNPLMECRNSFMTNCNSDGLIPSLRVSTNLFEKRENQSTQIRSAIHADMSVEGTLGTSSSTYIKNNESSQQINVNNVKKANNSVATTGVENNILLENKSHPFLNDSEISDIISTRLSHIEKSSDNLNLSCTSSQVNLPLLKKAGNSKGKRKKQTVNSTVSPKFSSETDPSFDDSNTTCHSRDTSFMSNAQHSEENQGNKSNFQAEMEKNNYFSVCIKNFQKPQDIAEAVQVMFEIDNEIDKLTKLRQSLLLSLIDQRPKDSKLDSPNNSISNKRKKKNNSKAKKKKLNSQKNQNEMACSSFQIETPDSSQKYSQEIIQNEDTLTNRLDKHLQEKNNFQQKNKSSTPSNQNHIQDIRNTIDLDVNNLTGVPIICKVLRQENSLIIGTDNGKILYFDLHSSEKPFTVGISKHAISCLDYAYAGAELLVFTGTAVESNLKILRYKKGGNSKTVHLEDTIQAMQKEWSYFFIGGIRGYLTRYNYQRDKIEFEDRISEMAVMDLRATREGPRKVLIILFQDIIGNKHIHVRDAMSALHMRSIGEQMNTHINSLLVKDSSLLFSSKNEILVYNYCDGQFITKLIMPSPQFITFLHKNGNLLLATTSDGFVHAYNFKSMNSVGYIRCDPISLLVVVQDKLIFGSWLKTIKSVTIPKHMLAIR